MRRRGWSRVAGAAAGAGIMAWAGAAAASSGLESPDGGVVQMGRGGAWLARADDPLAVYFNPAAMAFQATGVHAGVQLMFQSRCFTRLGEDGQPVSPSPGIPGPGTAASPAVGTPPPGAVCSKTSPFPNPQLGAVFRITNQLALGLAVIGPHASGSNSWPETLTYTNRFGIANALQASSQRYLLESASSLIITPTFSIAYAPLDNLSFGAGFVWGIASVDFVNFAQSTATNSTMTFTGDYAANDVKAEFKGKDLFIPGFVLSALWSPSQNLDLSAWYHWQDAIKFTGDLGLTAAYFSASAAPNAMPCAGMSANCNVTNKAGAGTLAFQIPMEAKLGLRFHLPRKDPEKVPGWSSAPGRKVRDPLSQDVFDVEVDFTWAHNSQVQNLELNFQPGIKINGGAGATVPSDASIPHMWKDVLGVRLGADVVVVPNVFALRAGGFFESKGQDDKYLNIDFDLADKIGVSGGATVRAGPVDISIAYAHTFYGTLDNGGKGGIYALAGTGTAAGCKGGPTTTNPGPGCFRSFQPINGGSLKESLDELGLGATVHF